MVILSAKKKMRDALIIHYFPKESSYLLPFWDSRLTLLYIKKKKMFVALTSCASILNEITFKWIVCKVPHIVYSITQTLEISKMNSKVVICKNPYESTYKSLRVTYKSLRLPTSPYEWPTNDLRMPTSGLRLIFENAPIFLKFYT